MWFCEGCSNDDTLWSNDLWFVGFDVSMPERGGDQ